VDRVRCVLGERSEFLSTGFAVVLSRAGGIEMAGHTEAPDQLPGLVDRQRPDVAVVGFEPPADSLSLLQELSRVPVLVLTWSARNDDLISAMRAGAAGLARKDAPAAEVVTCIREVARGRTAFPPGWQHLLGRPLPRTGTLRRDDPAFLTSREREIVQQVVNGCSNRDMAKSLGIAQQTAKNHLRSVMVKLAVTSRSGVSAWALERGYIAERTDASCQISQGAVSSI